MKKHEAAIAYMDEYVDEYLRLEPREDFDPDMIGNRVDYKPKGRNAQNYFYQGEIIQGDQPVQTYDFDLSEQAEVPPPAVEAPAPTPTPASPASIPASSPASTAAPPSPVAAPTTSPATPPAAAPVAAVTPASKPVAAPETGYFVQIGVFSNPASANRLATELRKKKFAVVVTKIDGAKPLHRVRVGPEPDRKAAEALAKRLASAGHKGSVVSAP
jgi:cell division septation protein DedD